MPKSVDQRLEDLDALQAEPDASVRSAGIKTALRDRHRRVVARAANLAAESLLYELMSDLLAAHQRFLDRPVKTDPNCIAKKAIARALVGLDCADVSFYLARPGCARR